MRKDRGETTDILHSAACREVSWRSIAGSASQGLGWVDFGFAALGLCLRFRNSGFSFSLGLVLLGTLGATRESVHGPLAEAWDGRRDADWGVRSSFSSGSIADGRKQERCFAALLTRAVSSRKLRVSVAPVLPTAKGSGGVRYARFP